MAMAVNCTTEQDKDKLSVRAVAKRFNVYVPRPRTWVRHGYLTPLGKRWEKDKLFFTLADIEKFTPPHKTHKR